MVRRLYSLAFHDCLLRKQSVVKTHQRGRKWLPDSLGNLPNALQDGGADNLVCLTPWSAVFNTKRIATKSRKCSSCRLLIARNKLTAQAARHKRTLNYSVPTRQNEAPLFGGGTRRGSSNGDGGGESSHIAFFTTVPCWRLPVFYGKRFYESTISSY